MNMKQFPVIDPIATGKNIIRLRAERGMSVRDLQAYFGFEEPQAIYKWQQGKSLPSVDNLYALGALFEVPMEDILVSRTSQLNLIICEQQAVPQSKLPGRAHRRPEQYSQRSKLHWRGSKFCHSSLRSYRCRKNHFGRGRCSSLSLSQYRNCAYSRLPPF